MAAFWVVLFHLSEGNHIPLLTAWLPPWVTEVVFHWGHLGVPVFFVLSGYVMALTSRKMAFEGTVPLRFVLRRLVRLAPPYYLAILLALASGFAKGDLALTPDTLLRTAAHLVYLQDILGQGNLNSVFWTLAIEVQFYLALALLQWLARKGAFRFNERSLWLCLFAVTGTLGLCWPAGLIQDPVWPGSFLSTWYSFVVGVLVGRPAVTRTGEVVRAGFLLAVLGVGLWCGNAFALTATVTAVLIEVTRRTGHSGDWLSAGWLQAVGRWSYSLYLLHNSATGIAFQLLHKAPWSGIAWEIASTMVTLAVCIAVAALGYRLVEKPAIAWSRKISLT